MQWEPYNPDEILMGFDGDVGAQACRTALPCTALVTDAVMHASTILMHPSPPGVPHRSCATPAVGEYCEDLAGEILSDGRDRGDQQLEFVSNIVI